MVRVNCDKPFCTTVCPVGQLLSVVVTVSVLVWNAAVASFSEQVMMTVQILLWVTTGAEVTLDATGLAVAFGSGQL